MKAKGYTSLGSFAKALDLHRNTLHHYLSGHSVFPAGLNRILAALDVEPNEILMKKETPKINQIKPIVEIVDVLEREFPNVTYVLFGSRTRTKFHPYADWDLGVFSVEGIPHPLYRRIKKRLSELAENFPCAVDLTHLNRADGEFLKNISKGWVFLGGKLKDWVTLHDQIH